MVQNPQGKPQAVNPKHTVIRKVLTKARAGLIRGVGALGRVQVNPSAADAELAKLEAELGTLMQGFFAAGGLLAVNESGPLPSNGWVFQALSGKRNAKHGNLSCGPVVGVMHEGRLAACGVLLAQAEDLVLAGAGEGANGPDGRLRVSPRDLPDAVVMLPMSSIDTAKLDIMMLADGVPFHTRKSGNIMADAVLVASGRADALIATRYSVFEHLCTEQLVKEAGGTVKVMKTPAGELLLAGNLKIVNSLTAKFTA